MALPQAKTIPLDATGVQVTDEVHCNHHLICYAALLDLQTHRQAMAIQTARTTPGIVRSACPFPRDTETG
jgi:hypothetical protein